MKYSLQSCMVVLLWISENGAHSNVIFSFMFAFHIGKYPEFLKWFEFGLQVWVCFWLMNSHLWSSKPRSKNCETVELTSLLHTGDGMCVSWLLADLVFRSCSFLLPAQLSFSAARLRASTLPLPSFSLCRAVSVYTITSNLCTSNTMQNPE